MNNKWLRLVVIVFVFSVTGCEGVKKVVKNADEWVKTNIW